MRWLVRLGPAALILVLTSCVTQDMNTGKMVPRGQQGMQFSDVEKAAENLKDGMTRAQVMLMLGSPAERSDDGDVWVYLPERYAILVPARALRLEFKDGVLADHGYRPIVLGARL
jgi:outer membrane protein assembly factor BamE (lipoprotein component of BamABCDE complex)